MKRAMKNEMKFDAAGLIPAIVQNDKTGQVLMLGYMNEASFQQTLETKRVTFYSRSRQEIWEKGATSGHFLLLEGWSVDCDQDALLIRATPQGPTCHTGAVSCFGTENTGMLPQLSELIETIDSRFAQPKEGSYIASLIAKGLPKIAQKVGEEGVELVIEAIGNDRRLFLEEAADLLFHYLVLLRAKDCSLEDVLKVLAARKR